MKRPLILISPSFELRGVEFNDLSVSLSLRYEQAVLAAGGLPVIGPATVDRRFVDRRLLAESVRRADGVLLSGGDDINPYLYETKLPRSIRKTVSTTPDGGRRDTAELMLIAEIFRSFVKACRTALRNSIQRQNGFVGNRSLLLRTANLISSNQRAH